MMRKISLLVLVIAVGALGWLAWSERSGRLEAERSLGLDAARMVNAKFQKKADVRVGTLAGDVTVRAEYDGTIFDAEQVTNMPASVDYFIELDRITKRSYRWDSSSTTLSIVIPDVLVGDPNLDEARAVIKQGGVIISRKAGRELAKQTSERAGLKVAATAREPKNLERARSNAREVITGLAREPLVQAGLGDVRVAVSFPWEPKVGGPTLTEDWDRSRRPEDVLSERSSAH